MTIEVVALVERGLGNSSYLVGLGEGRALVIDPQRDPTPYRMEMEKRGWVPAATAETHESGSTYGVGGATQRYTVPGSLSFREHVITNPVTVFRVANTEEDRRYNNFVLLGREDFFKQFAVSFDWKADPSRFTITPYPVDEHVIEMQRLLG